MQSFQSKKIMEFIQATSYKIFFNDQIFKELTSFLEEKTYSKIIILVDENTNNFCLPHFLSHLATEIAIEIIEIEAGEENKNIATCLQLWEALSDLGADRKSVLLNLGGGVVTDIGGFVASTFQRGIDFINIPTTLLAMVDASVGGKTGVDLGNLKNQIGTFQEPKLVLVFTPYLATLTAQEMRSGLAEMLKHGLIIDKNYWKKLKNINNLKTEDLDTLIKQSVDIKNQIVIQDFKESSIRKILNFGHTLGHGIESYFLENASKTKLLHGEAIAIGMVLESYISMEQNGLQKEAFIEIKNTIFSLYENVNFDATDIAEIIKLLDFDKKNEAGKVYFVLLEEIGKAKTNQIVDKALIYRAFEDYNQS